ncbi:MAG TPA: glutaminyl-peptide cyclotransferase [Pyrinomonadaceae bacterium]|nr:glutaminyl-peptide cyclotransferase [Pyrinomonadaceae bacterium]
MSTFSSVSTQLSRPVFSRTRLALVLALALASLTCNGSANTNSNATPTKDPANLVVGNYGYQVVNIWPHDPSAFTQGLVFLDGKMLESTGQEGRSTLRSVELETGKVLKKVAVPEPYFAEGLALLNNKLYQLTWQHQVGFIYDPQTFQKTGEFTYSGEGWGLASDGHSLILSDGTNRLRFIDPDSFRTIKTIAVLDGKTPINELNELEYVKGEIYANIWHDDRIVVIDPQTGLVTAWIDLRGLLQPGDVQDAEAVLNGIAYDQKSDRLFVTGKLWPRLFEIKIKK